MKITSFLIALIIFTPVFCFAQEIDTNGHFRYLIPDKIPEKYTFSGEGYAAAIREKYSGKIKNLKLLNRFINEAVYTKAAYFQPGYIYYNWNEMEDYINNVLKKVLPEQNVKYYPSQVYIVRDPEINACAFEDGTIFVNIGLMANIKDEATLAGVLGHELGHYFNNDAFEGFKKSVSLEKKIKFFRLFSNGFGFFGQLISYSNFFNYSQDTEKEADDYSVNLIQDSPYTFNGLVNTFNLFDNIEKKSKLKRTSSSGLLTIQFNTHPSTKERQKKAKQFFLTETEGTKKSFIVDEEKFFKLQKMAADEVENIHSEQYQLLTLIEHCFVRYLYEPDNINNIEQLIEFLQQFLVISPKSDNKPFITNEYKLKKFKINKFKHIITLPGEKPSSSIAVKKSIFNQFYSGILFIDSTQIAFDKLQHLFETDTIQFYSYRGALEYFRKKAEEKNCKSCLLPIALSRNSEEEKKYYLKKYLEEVGSEKYKAFAENLYSDEYQNITGIEDLVVLYNHSLVANHLFLSKDLFDKEHSNLMNYSEKLQAVLFNDPNATYVYTEYPYLSTQDKSMFDIIYDIINKRINKNIIGFTTESFDLLTLSPEVWQFIINKNISSLMFFQYYNYNEYLICEIISYSVKEKRVYNYTKKFNSLWENEDTAIKITLDGFQSKKKTINQEIK